MSHSSILERWWYPLADRLARRSAVPPETALREAVAWIYRAQDATPDRGVSHSYGLGRGWAPSYPETTGYIIPTLLNWWKASGEDEARRRALEMAAWESDVQLPDGSVMASVVGRPRPKPAVFDTGQAIFGWLAAHQASGECRFLESALRAADWLLGQLGSGETWRTYGNMGEHRPHTFNIRVVWALLELDGTAEVRRFRQPICRVVKWVLSQERGRGWFDVNCLTDNERPLLHTIAYTAQGLLESGCLLEDSPCIDAAQRTADALREKVASNGWMAGRFDHRWTEASRSACLTGMAQMSIVWRRLHAITGEIAYSEVASSVNRYLRGVQRVRCNNPGIRGGIPGSFPIDGKYGRNRLLNWATKFFIDALLPEFHSDGAAAADLYPG